MSRRDARTANPTNSIWLDLPENAFRQHLVALEGRTNAIPIDPQAFPASEWLASSSPASEERRALPFVVEQQLADDFASLVAVEEGAQSVAAVCIEEHLHAPGLTLRFAALDLSLNESVKHTLEETSNLLARASSESKDASFDYIEELFDFVVRLHFRRLLARLRSVKWEKPKHLSKSHKKPLWKDFANLISRVHFLYTRQEKALRQNVEKQLSELGMVYEAFESAAPGEDCASLRDLINASYRTSCTEEILDYARRLDASVGSKATSQVASAIKCLRQIMKIAATRRICLFLVTTATNYPSVFQSRLSLAYLTPYKSVSTTIGYEDWATTCHVHAEVQLAVHYDLISQQCSNEVVPFMLPRCIGISKWLCYLCYHFLRAHKQFFPSKTHGRLYDQWTIPDLAEFNENNVQRYRGIIRSIDKEVVQHTEREPELWRLQPMTSIDYPTLSSLKT